MGQLQWIRNLHGMTDPWLVASYDHLDKNGNPRLFVLKHFREGDLQSRIAEYVAGKIAEELDIGAPAIELLEVTPEFLHSLRYVVDPEPIGLEQARPNLHIAVAYDEHAAPMSDDVALLGNLSDSRQIADIIAVDTLVQNGDRHIGNLLIRPVAVGRYARHKLVPIDWSHALQNASHPDLLRGISWTRGLLARSPLCLAVRSRKDFRSIRARIESWGTDARVRALVEWIPREWGLPQHWRRRLEIYILNRIATTLHDLDRTDNSDGRFPNWQYSVEI